MSAVYIGPNDPDVDANLCDHAAGESHCVHDWRVVPFYRNVQKTLDSTSKAVGYNELT
jgi:hypothetical protein